MSQVVNQIDHSPSWTFGSDPKLPIEVGRMNGREAPGSGRAFHDSGPRKAGGYFGCAVQCLAPRHDPQSVSHASTRKDINKPRTGLNDILVLSKY
jgi:hypothetical protein